MYISIPSLGMVDDVMVIQKCLSDSVRMNPVVNSFVEAKKLTLSIQNVTFKIKETMTERTRVMEWWQKS